MIQAIINFYATIQAMTPLIIIKEQLCSSGQNITLLRGKRDFLGSGPNLLLFRYLSIFKISIIYNLKPHPQQLKPISLFVSFLKTSQIQGHIGPTKTCIAAG